MNEIQQGHAHRDDYFAMEILKAKARFIHLCLGAILPKELYDLAARDNEMPRCEKWAKDNGYYWHEVRGETRLMKGPIVIARFTPRMVGAEGERHCEFDANILGKRVPVVLPELSAN